MDGSFRRTNTIDLQALKKGILNHEMASLSKSITLVESQSPLHRKLAMDLLESLTGINSTPSKRIGITGVPGVGKSTFIENFGCMLTGMGHRVAVLSIDPSSAKSRGSILGDKTRMEKLVKEPNAYIRPSASGLELGGVARATKEAILLCEAAGYDTIIVETVGVGQSETAVKSIVDYFLLLMLPGGGDELQGIKRGIMEMADHIVINKSDGERKKLAKKSAVEYRNAVHLMPPHEAGWVVPVEVCSALEQQGLEEIWGSIERYFTKHGGWLSHNRKSQELHHFKNGFLQLIEQHVMGNEKARTLLHGLEQNLKDGSLNASKAITMANEALLENLFAGKGQ